MTDKLTRFLLRQAIWMILAGMFLGGVPLIMAVVSQAYSQPPLFHPPGDYRGWMMAHLEGLLNGLLVLGLALGAQVAPPARPRLFATGLMLGGWGNTAAAILAPMLGVRGMVFDGQASNDAIAAMFGVALIGTIVAISEILRALYRGG